LEALVNADHDHDTDLLDVDHHLDPSPLKGAAALAALDEQGKLFCYAADVAAVFDKDLRTVYTAMDRGEIPSVKMGQRRQIPLAWVHRQVEGTDAPEQARRAGSAA
jgi:hypothetical protein